MQQRVGELFTKQMVCYVIEQKPNSCVVLSPGQLSLTSEWTYLCYLMITHYSPETQQLHASDVLQISARVSHTAFV